MTAGLTDHVWFIAELLSDSTLRRKEDTTACYPLDLGAAWTSGISRRAQRFQIGVQIGNVAIAELVE